MACPAHIVFGIQPQIEWVRRNCRKSNEETPSWKHQLVVHSARITSQERFFNSETHWTHPQSHPLQKLFLVGPYVMFSPSNHQCNYTTSIPLNHRGRNARKQAYKQLISLSLKSHQLDPLEIGDTCRVQNQTGRFPKKCDKIGTSTVLQEADNDQLTLWHANPAKFRVMFLRGKESNTIEFKVEDIVLKSTNSVKL